MIAMTTSSSTNVNPLGRFMIMYSFDCNWDSCADIALATCRSARKIQLLKFCKRQKLLKRKKCGRPSSQVDTWCLAVFLNWFDITCCEGDLPKKINFRQAQVGHFNRELAQRTIFVIITWCEWYVMWLMTIPWLPMVIDTTSTRCCGVLFIVFNKMILRAARTSPLMHMNRSRKSSKKDYDGESYRQ